MTRNLLDRTLELARETDVPVSKICTVCGFTSRWYYMLLSGEIQDPSVRRIQRLHDFLSHEEARVHPPEVDRERRTKRPSADTVEGVGAAIPRNGSNGDTATDAEDAT